RSKEVMRRRAAERAAINAPMQGTAADIIKRAMITLHGEFLNSDRVHMILQVHDELIFEVREDSLDYAEPIIRRHMENAASLAVPLVVGIGVGSNWDEAH
ncbi:MAG: DNA polymerase I, partial [Gammaproteobacteria bacterium]|nr:DNA polymerase I [Gammaproteobacteria bacterium]